MHIKAEEGTTKGEIITNYEYSDEILSFHYENELLLLIGKTNKKVEMFKNFEKIKEYTHPKKMTNSIYLKENNSSFLILSDKFGEITIKKSTQKPSLSRRKS